MIIYSEKTEQKYNSVEECLAAEAEFDDAKHKEEIQKEELKKLKQARAQEIADAYQSIVDARTHFKTLVENYEQEFGKIHFDIQVNGKRLFPWF